MHILIIGSEGFIGRHLVKRLLSRGDHIHGIDLVEAPSGDYTYHKISRLQPEFTSIFEQQNFDYCINAAGSGSVPLSISEPQRDFDANVQDTLRILESIRLHNVSCRYVHVSSAAVYGNPARLPVKEDMQLAPLSPYGYHKWMSELLCGEFHTIYNVKTTILRPFSVYGPGLRKQLIWDLYHKISKGADLDLFGTGRESRDFIYIEDLAEAVVTIMDHADFDNTVYNIASGRETTIKQVVDLFREIMGSPCNIRFNNQKREGDPANWQADISRIGTLGFSPAFPLNDGLAATYEWLKQTAIGK